jgi:hypothetical protein
MDWGKWIGGKTKREIEARVKEWAKDLRSPGGMIEYEMAKEYAKSFRPDLWKEIVSNEGELIRVYQLDDLSEEEKELKAWELFVKVTLVLNEIKNDGEIRERPAS